MIKQQLKHAPGGYQPGSADISCYDNVSKEAGVLKCGVEYYDEAGRDCLVYFRVRQSDAEMNVPENACR